MRASRPHTRTGGTPALQETTGGDIMVETTQPLAILAGVRTPFAKAFGALANVPADQLGRLAVEGVLPRAGVRPADVGELVFGNVAGQADASNVARVIALRSGIPQDRVAHTV